ncbi:MAG: hypothetical protein L0H54_13340, partial [Alcaligenaceae bacterium]|nr:hypothetical protein [Alcaligenaceae bacterium]
RHGSVGYDRNPLSRQMVQNKFRLTQNAAADMDRVAALTGRGGKTYCNRLHGFYCFRNACFVVLLNLAGSRRRSRTFPLGINEK